MFHIYKNNIRITEHPISYNYILRTYKIEAIRLNDLHPGESISFEQFIFVRQT